MAEQPKTENTITENEAPKKKVKIDAAKASDPAAAEAVAPPAAPVIVALPKKSMKKHKLLPKNKHRLPRRQKNAQHEAATRL